MDFARAEGRFPTLRRADGVEHWLIPVPACPACSAPMAEAAARCAACDAHDPFPGSILRRVVAATLYLSPDSRFKSPHTAELLALKASGAHADVYADVLAQLLPPAAEGAFDAVVPIPPRASPGADALARELASRLGAPVLPLLSWSRLAASQKTLKREARFANVRDAMLAKAPAPPRALLVDDIAASCATLLEAARALAAAGARECVAAVAGRESNTHALQRAGLIHPL